MATVKKIKGKNLMLFLDTKTVVLTTSCDLTLTANYDKSASKDSGKWDEMELDKITYSGSNDSFMAKDPQTTALAHEELMDKFLAGESVAMTFGIPTNYTEDGVPEGGWTEPTTHVLKGTVKITSINFNGPTEGNATFKISFEGCGPLTKVAGV